MTRLADPSMRTAREDFRPFDASGILSWVQFGDLHLTTGDARNYRDLLALIAAANDHLQRVLRRAGAYPSKGLLGPNKNGHGWGPS